MEALERLARTQPAALLVTAALPAVYWSPLVTGIAAAAVVLTLAAFRRRSPLLPLALLGLLFAFVWQFRSLPVEPHWPFAVEGAVAGEGTVAAEAAVNRGGVAPFRFRVETVQRAGWVGHADAVVTVAGWRGSSPATGSRWRFRGDLLPGGALRWTSGEPLGWAAPWWAWRAAARAGLHQSLQGLGAAPSALGEALLIGAVDDLTPAEKQAFRDAGCSHVLALSGMHLSLLAVALTWLLQRRLPPRTVFVLTQIVLALFCFLAGPLPSLLRAWVMAALAGWWGLRRRPVPLKELLSQSFLVSVLLWPSLAGTLSLQLSFLAMAGLFWWNQRWDRFLRPRLGRWGAAQLASSAAAVAATAPLVLLLFGELRWVGLFLTPPLVLLTTLHLLGALVVALLGWVPGLAAFVAPVFQAVYEATFAVTGCGAWFPALPGAVAAWVLGGLGVLALILYTARRSRPLPVSLNYDSPAALQAFLDGQGYNALKRWGQNFLINAGARRQILAALDLQPGEAVWEVGPGLGALTHQLVAEGHPVTAFEIDPGYVKFLREEFGGSAGFQVVDGDVVKTWKTQPLSGIKTVGNLPYNAASAIVADFIEGGFFPSVFVVTVQLEMAQRMTASPSNKNYSSFSVLCQSAFKLDEIVTLKPGSFYPAPDVTSRVVRLRPHGLYAGLDHARFSRFVRECFSSRRKTLRNNLPGAASALHVSDAALTAAFAEAGVDLALRAEVLTVDRFVNVFRALGPLPE